MKNKYYWPYYTGIVILLIWVAVSCILGVIVTYYSGKNGNYPPPYFFPLLIFAPDGILIIATVLTFVEVTKEEIIYFKFGLLRRRIKLSDVTECGVYIKSGGRCASDVLYITSIPIYDLRCGNIINKKALKHKNKKKFIMVGYDDKRLIAFVKENFPLNREFLYEKPEYVNSIDDSPSIFK